jgi:hypothetical protein
MGNESNDKTATATTTKTTTTTTTTTPEFRTVSCHEQKKLTKKSRVTRVNREWHAFILASSNMISVKISMFRTAPPGKLADLSREVSREEVCASAQMGLLARFTPLK